MDRSGSSAFWYASGYGSAYKFHVFKIGLSIVTRYIQLTLPAAFNDVLRQENAMVQTGETGDHSDPK
jgi:hypothetical protein